MQKEYSPVSYSEARHYADIAKNMPRSDVEILQRILLRRAIEAGTESPSVLNVICEMTDRFVDEDYQMRRELMAEEMRRNGIISLEKIDAEDEQIVLAIKKTLPKFQSDWDWGGIYRILVDFCNHLGFSSVKTKFVERMARMGVYPKDNVVEITRSLPSSIRGTEWHDHQFSYLAVQRGVKTSWPKIYPEWMKSGIQSRDFLERRSIATLFLENLRKVI